MGHYGSEMDPHETGHAKREPEDSMSMESQKQLKELHEKLQGTGYPGLGPPTSQADVIKTKANIPSMHATSIGIGHSPEGSFTVASAVNNTKGQHICDICGKAYNPVLPHDCFNKDKALQELGKPEVMVGSDAGNALVLDIRNIPNEQARRVLIDILPGLLELYLKKSKDYGGDVGEMLGLGPKAHFVDMWRKMGKLKRALWDGVELEGEGPEEIMMDLVGHILIILDKMRNV